MMTDAKSWVSFFTSRGEKVSLVPDQISVSFRESNRLVSDVTTS
jgi:hypothetical protein